MRAPSDSPVQLLAGVVEWRRAEEAPRGAEAFNSAVLLAPEGKPEFVYDKIHLVPFGEYVPLRRWLRFAESLTRGVGDFRAGTERRVGRLPGGRFAVFICYEAVFPGDVREFTRNGAELLINLSNDAWFGRSAAPEQHLQMARLRAIENRRWMLRGTNNGHTVAVDPYGRMVARLAPDVRAALAAPYAFRRDASLYVRWGDWFAVLCGGVSALLTAGALFRIVARKGS
jgi:apolipoprotein N-acyltransferase